MIPARFDRRFHSEGRVGEGADAAINTVTQQELISMLSFVVYFKIQTYSVDGM